MIEQIIIGNLFESKAQSITNTVNCVGVMGKGVALEFKVRFPEMYKDYIYRCSKKQVRLGEPYLFRSLFPPNILNFPTKEHWRSVSRLSDIIRGLVYLKAHYQEWGIISLAVPPLGCGSGGLEWKVVGPTLARFLNNFDIPVYLYAPYGTPNELLDLQLLLGTSQLHTPVHSDRIQPGLIAIVEVLKRIHDTPFHWPVGRVIFQKIAYFASQVGIPVGLEYQRGSYGPFSKGLKAALSTLINQGLIVERPLGQMIAVEVGPTYHDAFRTYSVDIDRWDEKINHVADLLLRFSNTHQSEMAATVHFVANELGETASEDEVLEKVMEWKQHRKPPFSQSEVALTIRNLAALGWIKVRASNSLLVSLEEEFAF